MLSLLAYEFLSYGWERSQWPWVLVNIKDKLEENPLRHFWDIAFLRKKDKVMYIHTEDKLKAKNAFALIKYAFKWLFFLYKTKPADTVTHILLTT